MVKAIACAHPTKFIGCRAGKTSRFAVLDIDAGSKYHNQQQLDKLLAVLGNVGLSSSFLYRSSYSGGWHLYLFFSEPLNSAELRLQLLKLLTLNGFEVARGMLEIFPNRSESSLGMGLRLPLQPGFAWIDKRDLEVDCERAEMTPTKALETFLDDLENGAMPYASFRQLKNHVQELENRKSKASSHGLGAENNVIPIRRNPEAQPSEFSELVTAIFKQLPPGIIADNWYKGRLFHINGLSAPSQRAEAIVCVSHYFFYGDPSRDLTPLGYGYEHEREWALKEFLSARHNEQSKDINAGRTDALGQVERAANWVPAHRKGVDPLKYAPVQPIAWIRGNEKREAEARTRIQEVFNRLRATHRPFTTVELQEAAECSRRTLYKHKDIWYTVYRDRKDYQDVAAGFFANCTGEYNDVVGADSSKIKPPSLPASEAMPPSLLAARRIAFEISRRVQKDREVAQKTSLGSLLESEVDWRTKVKALTSKPPAELSIRLLKSVIVTLASYLPVAPTYEDATELVAVLSAFKQDLADRFMGSMASQPLIEVVPDWLALKDSS